MDTPLRRLALGLFWGAVLAAALGVADRSHTRNLENWFLGHMFKFRGAQAPSPDVVMISIGNKDLVALGAWQWSRSYHSLMLEVLKDLGAKTIGYDILFLDNNETDPAGDEQLITTLSWMDNVVLPMIVEPSGRSAFIQTYPFSGLREAAPFLGYVDLTTTKDKNSVALDLKRGDVFYYGVQILASYLNAPSDRIVLKNGSLTVSGSARSVEVPVGDDARTYINYTGPSDVWKWRSFTQVLRAYKNARENGTSDVLLDEFKDKIVLVGTTDTHLGDLWQQPFGLCYGVEVHANFLNSALQGDFIRRLPEGTSRLISCGLVLVLCVLIMMIRLRYGVIAVVVTIASVLVASYLMFSRKHLWLDAMNFSLATVLAFLPTSCTKYIIEKERRQFILNALRLYLSPKVVREIEKHPDTLNLGGERRNLTVLFSDLAGFSTFSEALSPDVLVTVLNEYLSEMTDIVLENNGTIDKYEGDAIIAFFGAPVPCDNHPLLACRAALGMQKRLDALAPSWEKRGYPELRMRIGINTGDMVVGNIGSRQRMNYTVMGDAVNLAARLEGVNKRYGTRILVSQETCDKVADDLVCREIDRIRVVGKHNAVTIYEILGSRSEPSTKSVQLMLDSYQEGLARYRQRDWGAAIGAFTRALQSVPQDPPSLLFVSRCAEYANNPPGDSWDGVYSMEIK